MLELNLDVLDRGWHFFTFLTYGLEDVLLPLLGFLGSDLLRYIIQTDQFVLVHFDIRLDVQTLDGQEQNSEII